LPFPHLQHLSYPKVFVIGSFIVIIQLQFLCSADRERVQLLQATCNSFNFEDAKVLKIFFHHRNPEFAGFLLKINLNELMEVLFILKQAY